MIEVRELTKRYGGQVAVDRLTVTVRPGVVTGFLGPNGAGKSTTLRVIVGLDAPTSGTALVGGERYADLPRPLRSVGALLDAAAVDPRLTARTHLRILARSNGIGPDRIGAVLDLVGLSDVADQPIGGYSLGMRQRLGVATALLGDPPVLLFDEPVNGLDPEGARWLRDLLRDLADEGRTVLVSSHLIAEMDLDHLVVLGRGRLLLDAPVRELLARHPDGTTLETAYLGLTSASVRFRSAGRTNR